MPADPVTIGVEYRAYNATIRSRRLKLGLTQAQLATSAGVSALFVGEMERLRRVTKTPKALRVLAALGLDEDAQPEWIEPLELYGTRRIEQSVDAQLVGHSPLALLRGTEAESADVAEAVERDAIGDGLREAMSRLPYRERRVLEMSFGIGSKVASLVEIGEHFNISAARVAQIQQRALEQLKQSPLANALLCDGSRQIERSRSREHAERVAKDEALTDWMLKRDGVDPHAC